MWLILIGVYLSACAGIQSRYHSVSRGEDFAQIATRYGVSVAKLREKNPRAVSKGLKVGTKLYVPFETNPRFYGDDPEQFSRESASVPAVESLNGRYVWPVSGRMSSPFGKRDRKFHQGIDIVARKGTPVFAARSGHVIYSGNRIRGYGNLVIIKHADGFATIYAHLSRRHVTYGQYISRGKRLGLVGSTGHSNGPHLHFEIRDNSRPVNPLFYLQGPVAANIVNR